MYERLLVAVDHSEVSDRVIAAARDIASLSKGKVWVLHLALGQGGDIPGRGDHAVRDLRMIHGDQQSLIHRHSSLC